MTTATISPEMNLTAWTGWLRRQHNQLNAWHFGGRLSAPGIEFVDLEDGINATYHRGKGEPVLRFNLAAIAGIGFLDDHYGSTLRRVRMTEMLKHELAHQAADQLHGYPPTEDEDYNHRNYGFRLACATLGIAASKCSAEWLYL